MSNQIPPIQPPTPPAIRPVYQATPVQPQLQATQQTTIAQTIRRNRFMATMKLLGGLAVWALLCAGSYPLVKSFAYSFKAKDFVRNQIELEYQQRAAIIERQYDVNMVFHNTRDELKRINGGRLTANDIAKTNAAEKSYKNQIAADKKELRAELESQYANSKPGSADVAAIDVEASNLAMMICGGLLMIIALPVGLTVIFR